MSHEISKKKVVYETPEMNDVIVRRDIEIRTAVQLDLYYPPDWPNNGPRPAVIIVAGYPDPGFQAALGCRYKEMQSTISWARLIATVGMVAVTYTTAEPATDAHAVFQAVRQNAATLGLDDRRMGVCACSGHVPVALSLLMHDADTHLKCAALCYGYMLDLDGATGVSEVARKVGFANPCAGRSVADLRRDTPLFVVRAGRDELPHLNETLDRFVAAALACNLPITIANHAGAPHAFDLFHDSETSREIIRQILAFLKFHLAA